MLRRLIIFLIRKKLGVKKNQYFRFTNQKSDDIYHFSSECLIKHVYGIAERSDVSLNWLLSEDCKVHSLTDDEELAYWDDVTTKRFFDKFRKEVMSK